LHQLDHFLSKYFCQQDSEKKKCRHDKWSIVCFPKDQGGLGVHDLEVKNRALLGKWLTKLLTGDGVWHTILRRKYVDSSLISQVFWKHGDSHFWASLMATKQFFFHLALSPLKRDPRLGSGRTKGLGNATF
jgi:hypothetical protein